MAAMKTGSAVPDRYLELILAFPLRPIRTDAEHHDAVVMLDALIDRGELAPEEEDYMDVLGELVRAYEDEHHPLPAASDMDMLRHLIESRGVTQADVSAATGVAESTLSSILSGRRGLNRNHIASLARYFKVSPAVFISV
jgi:HTH-type transcriptional regulator / antitoxin HigA